MVPEKGSYSLSKEQQFVIWITKTLLSAQLSHSNVLSAQGAIPQGIAMFFFPKYCCALRESYLFDPPIGTNRAPTHPQTDTCGHPRFLGPP